ncbi:single-stranded DNA-binding protein [Microbacterium sp. LRZ72]|uniref:single-stranded DNA-binding protein n=1 Tax=Microbacterium sp. LRZ72 TaxID=2942481 RepID=UPI0029A76F0E|nr:single-stranded DNA-binding protein [Microbacterium sp. LRZ72]MDX2375531.1 single-stranded DNA-binding protein [Microbacterium sp. LRZ72]
MTDHITITGNVASDVAHKMTPAGLEITTFRLASGSRRFDRATSSWIDGPTNWYSVSAYRSLAVNAHRSLEKGQRVIVSGRLRLRAWENGDKRGTAVEIDADALGHDLLWGTSRFERSHRPPGSDADTPDEAEWHASVPGEGSTGGPDGQMQEAGVVTSEGPVAAASTPF